MFGFLSIHKPAGMSSQFATNRVKRVLGQRRVGHAGTLDPLATGVLLVALGSATRLVQWSHDLPKRYRASFVLGRTSPSDDTDTPVEELTSPPIPTLEQLQSALPSFVGQITQRPPIFSAIKIDGRAAYKRARKGEAVAVPARTVRIDSIDLLSYEYPRLELDIACGSGTYIRALGRDLAESLGTAAVMEGLVRTAIGPFAIESALTLPELSPGAALERLAAPLLVLPTMRRFLLDADREVDIRHGRFLEVDLPSDELVAAISANGELVAILHERCPRLWAPKLVFPRE